QMTEASFEKTNVTIAVSNAEKEFVAVGEVLKFDGFLKVYMESTDDDTEESTKGLLPAVKIDDELKALEITASQKFSLKPPRYTEASLVKKLEDLGIGRPSTYAPTISTIQARGYVVKEDRKGYQRTIDSLVLKDVEIKEKQSKENTGYEKSKLFPTDIGIVVTDFLVEHFERILDYNFTATVEEEFDEIASGKLIWNKMIEKFYSQFHQKVEKALESSTRSKGERILGDDPVSGKPISVKIGRYGPIAQIGSVEDEEKPKFASLRKGQHLETISLEEALELFKLPRDIGVYEDEEVVASIGRFGPYLRHKSKFYSLNKNTDDPHTVELDRAIEIIEEKREKDKKSVLKTFEEEPELRVLQGRYGPYISYKKKNYRIPKSKNPEELTLDECKELIESGNNKTGKSKVSRKKK
ncbi:MAG: DNA topoisomerase I, partial [Marinilabiliales bacterium]